MARTRRSSRRSPPSRPTSDEELVGVAAADWRRKRRGAAFVGSSPPPPRRESPRAAAATTATRAATARCRCRFSRTARAPASRRDGRRARASRATPRRSSRRRARERCETPVFFPACLLIFRHSRVKHAPGSSWTAWKGCTSPGGRPCSRAREGTALYDSMCIDRSTFFFARAREAFDRPPRPCCVAVGSLAETPGERKTFRPT